MLIISRWKVEQFSWTITHEHRHTDSRGREKKPLNWPQKIESILKSLLCVGTFFNNGTTLAKAFSTFKTLFVLAFNTWKYEDFFNVLIAPRRELNRSKRKRNFLLLKMKIIFHSFCLESLLTCSFPSSLEL